MGFILEAHILLPRLATLAQAFGRCQNINIFCFKKKILYQFFFFELVVLGDVVHFAISSTQHCLLKGIRVPTPDIMAQSNVGFAFSS